MRVHADDSAQRPQIQAQHERRRRALLIVLATLPVASLGAVTETDNRFLDPLDTPAQSTRFATTSQLGAITRAGVRLIAVGVRGLIVVSGDDGRTWHQVASPTSSDLVAVRFISATQGWASGHDGVILATRDGGEHWVKQLDGRETANLLKAHFTALAISGDTVAARMLKEIKLSYQSGPEVPMLDLWFDSDQTGWAVGPFGIILGTSDGGKTWTSWMERVDNGKMLHYNAISNVGGAIYLASEQGMLFRLDRLRNRFTAIATGYNGSFFGLVGARDYVIAYGIGGSAYRSRDNGVTWQRLSTGLHGSITGACVLDGRVLFVSQDSHLLLSEDEGDTFRRMAIPHPGLFTDVAPAGPDHVVLTGLAGVQRVNLK